MMSVFSTFVRVDAERTECQCDRYFEKWRLALYHGDLFLIRTYLVNQIEKRITR